MGVIFNNLCEGRVGSRRGAEDSGSVDTEVWGLGMRGLRIWVGVGPGLRELWEQPAQDGSDSGGG